MHINLPNNKLIKIEPYVLNNNAIINNKTMYTCMMCINHSGRTSNSGHYTTMVIDKNDNVVEVSDEAILNLGNYSVALCGNEERNSVNRSLSIMFLG